MFRFESPLNLRLQPGQLLTWRQANDATLRVVSGRVWVTRADDLADHFLHAGEVLALQGDRWATIGAEGEVCFSLEATRRVGGIWQRWAARGIEALGRMAARRVRIGRMARLHTAQART